MDSQEDRIKVESHFLNKKLSFAVLEGLYQGASAFLICNGPSFATLDHNLLRKPGIMTFGVNNGPKSFRPNFWACVDDPVRFIKSIWLDPKIMKFVPLPLLKMKLFDSDKWTDMKTRVVDCPNVVCYCRDNQFNAATFLTQNNLNWGGDDFNGSYRSVMLPALRILNLLGFRKVYLLGCDFKMSSEYAYHFNEKANEKAINCNASTYDKLKSEYFPALKPVFDADGFMVYNCNAESELKVFPFVRFEDAVKEATEQLGDVEHERVQGLYSNSWERRKLKEAI